MRNDELLAQRPTRSSRATIANSALEVASSRCSKVDDFDVEMGSRTSFWLFLADIRLPLDCDKARPRTSNTASDRVTPTLSLWRRDMGSTTEITASPKLRSIFAVAAFIMFALW